MTQDTQNFNALKAAFDKDFEKAQAKHTLLTAVLAALDRTVEAPERVYEFGYCADASLHFSGANTAGLLTAYPPEPLVLVVDGSLAQKPEAYVRDSEKANADVLPLAPLIFKESHGSKGELRWWTRLADNLMAQVSVEARRDVFSTLVGSQKYRLESHTYSTGCTSYGLRGLVQLKTEDAAVTRWLSSWDAFVKTEGYTGGQQQFLNAIRGFIMSPVGVDWLAEGLPEPHGPRPGTAVAIPPGRDMVEYLEELQAAAASREEHWMDRIGDFWRYFTHDEAAKLWAFCLERSVDWSKTLEEDFRQAAAVATALEELYQAGYPPSSDPRTSDRVNHAVRAKTGLAPIVWPGTIRADGSMAVEIRFTNAPSLAPHRFTIKVNRERRLRPQDVPVTYAE